MKATPLVSIIIPAYNRAHLIGETLDSILAQTYTNWECIVVDDGSTDRTLLVLASFAQKDTRIQFHKRPQELPKGANSCRNYGFELCNGKYIQWFDSDDIMHQDKLKTKIEVALMHNANVIVSKHSTSHLNSVKEFNLENFVSETFYIDYILGKKSVITNDVMLSSSIIGNTRFDVNLHKAQEYDFFSRVFQQKLAYCFIDVSLTLYRVSSDSISIKTSKGNSRQIESLIYLSKKRQKEHQYNKLIVEKAKRQGRKTYKWLIKKNKIKLLIKNFMFFKKSYDKSLFTFIIFFCYNMITKKGFDVMRIKQVK